MLWKSAWERLAINLVEARWNSVAMLRGELACVDKGSAKEGDEEEEPALGEADAAVTAGAATLGGEI